MADLPQDPFVISPIGTQAEDGEYLEELAGFLGPEGPCERPPGPSHLLSRFERPRRTEPSGLSAATEARIMALLSACVAPGAGREEAEVAASLLNRLCRRESLPLFRQMLRSGYGRVQESAYEALKAYGEAPPGFEPGPPARFRLLVGGEPLANTDVGYTITFTDGGNTSTGVGTNAGGVARLDRGLFRDPKRPVRSIEFGKGEEPNELRSEEMPPPRDLGAVTVVRLKKAPPRPAY